MANFKQRNPIRQFSLQYDSPKIQEKRRSLIKQFSEDLPNIKAKRETNIQISVSSKDQKKNNDRPIPAKIAWLDCDKKLPGENKTTNEIGIFINKCINVKKSNSPRKAIKQSSLEKDSILYSRQELAESLRQAWKDGESSKTNLNIVLTHTTAEEKAEDIFANISSTDRSVTDDKNNNKNPKIILPLKPDFISGDINMKNIFQKHIRKNVKQKSSLNDNSFPTRVGDKNEEKSNAIVVPVIDNRPGIMCTHKSKRKTLSRENTMENEFKEKNNLEAKVNINNGTENNSFISRPSTATSKREMFQKHSNYVFHGNVEKDIPLNRPPLLRTLSVPSKSEALKPKFVSTKRRVKTAKAKMKTDKESDDEQNSLSRKKLQRCVSVACVADVVTMVSLVSPSGSENEEDDADEGEEKEKSLKIDTSTTNKTSTSTKSPENDEEKNFSLRKTVKSVSFQQSSIHAVRSFSASFPGRRVSMATTLLLSKNSHNQLENYGQKIQEKRAPINMLENEENVPKRRLVRTKNSSIDKCVGKQDIELENEYNNENNEHIEQTEIEFSTKEEVSSLIGDDITNPSSKFDNPKEKQCWDMYCKMSKKGITISFDTILRGMLTPTEYRLRRKPSLLPEDNCEITEN